VGPRVEVDDDSLGAQPRQRDRLAALVRKPKGRSRIADVEGDARVQQPRRPASAQWLSSGGYLSGRPRGTCAP
jgi:hypothetical protein